MEHGAWSMVSVAFVGLKSSVTSWTVYCIVVVQIDKSNPETSKPFERVSLCPSIRICPMNAQ